VAVISAFALNNWNENRRDRNAEVNILTEISNGLDKDIEDVRVNILGHKQGIESCRYWRQVVTGQDVNRDTAATRHYFSVMRDFITIQNTSGYESLKSKGLELVRNDSLRFQIISLYEYEYNVLNKFEEEYKEAQFHESYFDDFNDIISPHLQFDTLGNIAGIDTISFTSVEQNQILSCLWKVEINRLFILNMYSGLETKIEHIKKQIDEEIN
jgi:hypothetical protein